MNIPLLSVIIPVFNVEPYLRECLDSIFCQMQPDVEVIAINDGSTDKSPEILEEYAACEKALTVIHMEHKGISSARNTGIRTAMGKYIFFVDSDDLIAPGALKEIHSLLSQGDFDFLEMDFIRFPHGLPSKSVLQLKPQRGRYYGLTEGNGQDLFADWINSFFFKTMACLRVYASQLLKENELYFVNGILFEDGEWVPRVFRFARYGKYVPLVAYIRRDKREGSIMTQFRTVPSLKAFSDLLFISDRLFSASLEKDICPSFSKTLKRSAGTKFIICVNGLWGSLNRDQRETFREELRSKWHRIRFSGSGKWLMMYYLRPFVGLENLRRIFLAFRWCKNSFSRKA